MMVKITVPVDICSYLSWLAHALRRDPQSQACVFSLGPGYVRYSFMICGLSSCQMHKAGFGLQGQGLASSGAFGFKA